MLLDLEWLGNDVEGIGDIDGDDIPDAIAGYRKDETGGAAVYANLNTCGGGWGEWRWPGPLFLADARGGGIIWRGRGGGDLVGRDVVCIA